MPDLRLPPEQQAGLAKLQILSDQTASSLLSAMRSAGMKADTDGLSVEDLPEIPGLSKTDAEEILETLVALYHIRAYADIELDEFVTDIGKFMKSVSEKDHSGTEDTIQQFRNRLKKFLGLEDVNRAAKSSVLRYEQERTVHGLRILTDARPVFGNDVRQSPEAAVIFHTLKIAYHHAGRLGEMFFSFDERDLRELKKAIRRAETKATSLRSVLTKAQVKVFNLE